MGTFLSYQAAAPPLVVQGEPISVYCLLASEMARSRQTEGLKEVA
jgi:hypothetical protein